MKQTLLRYCGHYRLQYMQGLNEILAPLLMISFEGIGGINMPKNFRYKYQYINTNSTIDYCYNNYIILI